MTPMLRSHFDSVDVVQSVYSGLLARLRDGQYALSKPDDFLALALTAIRNKLISKWRRAENEKRLLQSAAIAQSGDPGRCASSNPAELAERRDLIDRLLCDLTAADRQLVEWQLIGLTPTEMAARLECDPHALRAKLSRLRQELRRRSE
jgi:RNA polymerase sigma factor (sigma-70 family)